MNVYNVLKTQAYVNALPGMHCTCTSDVIKRNEIQFTKILGHPSYYRIITRMQQNDHDDSNSILFTRRAACKR